MRKLLASLCCAIELAACAPMVVTEPTRLQVVGAPMTATVVVRDLVEFRLPTGYSRSLVAGSRWRLAGRLPQGEVYRPVDAPFSIEGRQVHEAWLVVRESLLQGFYLPAESNYSPLVAPVKLNLDPGDPRP